MVAAGVRQEGWARAVMPGWVWPLVVAALLAVIAAPGAAQTDGEQTVLEAEDRMEALEAATRSLTVASSDDIVSQLKSDIEAARTQAVRCADAVEGNIARLKREREILAPAEQKPAEAPAPASEAGGAAVGDGAPAPGAAAPPAKEPAPLDKRRQALSAELARLEERQALCRLLTVRADGLLEQVVAVEQRQLARRLPARGPHILEVVAANLEHPGSWGSFIFEFLRGASGADELSVGELAGLLAVGALGFAVGVAVRRRMAGRPPPEVQPATTLGRLWWSFKACTVRIAPVALPLVFISLFLTAHALPGGRLPFINYLAYELLALVVVMRLTRVFLHPCPPASEVFELAEGVAWPLYQRLQVLWVVIFAGSVVFYTPLVNAFYQDAYLLARDIYIGFLVANTIWVIWLAGRLEVLRARWLLKAVLVLGFSGILGAELLGYRNLAGTLVRSALQTLGALGLLYLLLKVVEELFDGLEEGSGRLSRAVRRGLGIGPGDYVPGLGWVRLLAILSLWMGLLALLLNIWGLSDDGFRVVYRYVAEGFEIGTIQLVPAQLLGAVLVFALLLTLSGWIKSQMDQRWLAKVRMDRGAKEALVTTSGYVGVALAVLVGLSVAGLELTNLALIAGALSVGIGFGLQNVVNNFVSGLILLMERPIRTGDWIVVGSTEGYVRRISIRSTRIQTFDRADVIVPNSEIISNQVTNWMLSDPYGRLKLPVGVAYGSDVAKVEEIIMKAALEHPLVVHSVVGLMEPKVMFIAFGESSLDFELWCMLREVDMRMSVKSDLYFTIEREFRAQGIEIPFPQRDLHMRTWSKPQPGEGEVT